MKQEQRTKREGFEESRIKKCVRRQREGAAAFPADTKPEHQGGKRA